MNTPAPVAIGYVSASDGDVLNRQRDVICAHARAEGLTLARIVTDRFDGFTISQVCEAARHDDARYVIVPAETSLATARRRLAKKLEPVDATCVVVGDLPRTGPGTTTTLPAAGLRNPQPRHAARSTP